MSALSEIIRTKLLPWSQHDVGKRFIVGRPKMSVSQMPDNVRLIQHKITGKRVVVKGRRYYQNTRSLVAMWPKMRLNEVNKLKLVCVLKGHIDYQLGDYRIQCGPGNFIFIPPGLPHPDGTRPDYVNTAEGTSCDLLFFLLHPNAIQCWLNRSTEDGGRKEIWNYFILHEHTVMLFRVLMEEVIAREDVSIRISENLLHENLLRSFLSMMLREVSAGRVQSIYGGNFHTALKQNVSSDDFATQLKHYVQTNLHKTLTLDNVARNMFLSRAQFTRVVRRETGKTFNEFLLDSRMEKAKRLLEDSEWTVSAISAFVGFKSPRYFHTVFKRITGKTPLQFRELNKNPLTYKR